ncbi:NAD(P)/FAD-dependent oxidoreductase [Carboxylicivirga caseinilyticus]|uniref:NAD(P)/FAD-dependent oxidoreductase n=1 Tax=Carboxylicivirga caseinilyticus TaxID=3417572 RepID=UPI003D34B675|nr:FAD-binding oxidoreductase [Marinilabiliaceae bacterium A049]
MNAQTEILIVGQGLAGTLVSYHLHKNQIKHLVIDTPHVGSASKVAAGLINPIGIKRMVKSWNVDLFLPYAHNLYSEMEEFLQTRFFYPVLMDKIYGEKDSSFWQHRMEAGELQNYINLNNNLPELPTGIEAPFGYGQIKQGARLHIYDLLTAYRSFLIQSNMLIEANFKDEDLVLNPYEIRWNGINAKKILFCRGEKDSQSKLFEALNFRNTKGELLNIEIPDLELKNILLKGIFIMPVGKNNFKIGATFEHEWKDLSPSKEKKEELINSWKKISKLPLSIKDQLTGIRPTMHDRRPVIGFLPHQPNIGIFNGLGSRGGLIAPLLAQQFVTSLSGSTDQLYKEVKVERYYRN